MRAWIQEIVAIVIVPVGMGLVFSSVDENGFNGLKFAVGILVGMLGFHIWEKNDFISY